MVLTVPCMYILDRGGWNIGIYIHAIHAIHAILCLMHTPTLLPNDETVPSSPLCSIESHKSKNELILHYRSCCLKQYIAWPS